MIFRILISISLLSMVACQTPEPVNGCGPTAKSVNDDDLPSDDAPAFVISDYKLNGDCLEVTVAAGGCNGDNWELEMLAGSLAESLPPQRSIYFSMKNQEACLAFIKHTFSFDVSTLQETGDAVWLIFHDIDNPDGPPQKVLYEY